MGTKNAFKTDFTLNVRVHQTNMTKKTLIWLPIIGIVMIGLLFLFNPFLFWHLGSSYKTQGIIFRNKADKNITIEYQMQDSGAFGYNRRIVKVSNGLLFDSTEAIDTSKIDKSRWDKVDEYVNELRLKGG